ncbi:sigma-70 family RNA polymerase sigma factor [Paenibacillus sp. GSMTC-2017]|uniref:sigma-70 family RNA polymerase sigma factor n=1 Tax=Paenibacillus sp. GSMTC-2017 TaxID=2794350 RepID=UPI0018D7A33E|nr:sigma-70 family RNA polymerase sigma factor [Paenibacillus sp. GSMTC-2017]
MELEYAIKRACKGDKEAFVTAVRSVEASLYRVAKAIVKSDEDCADAMQETLLIAYRNVRTLREPKWFKTWIIRILIHECSRIMRKKKPSVPLSELHTTSHDDPYSRIDTKQLVDMLEEELRIVIVLYYFEDLPLKEVAQVLGQPEGTVKSRLYRARIQLAELLGATSGDEKGGVPVWNQN